MTIKTILGVTAFAALSVSASMAQAEVSGPWDISSVELREVADASANKAATIALDPACSSETMSPMDLSALADIDWGTIINIGQKLWTVVEANKPVVDLGKTPVAFALPRGLTCWNELDSWQAPKVSTYDVSYKNGFGMEVVKFRFRLQYTYGGGKQGKGKYLANVAVIPAEVNVMWGYTFSANVDVNQAVNLGSGDSPLAGLEMNLKWTVKTVFKESDNSFHFFVQGDGVSQAQN